MLCVKQDQRCLSTCNFPNLAMHQSKFGQFDTYAFQEPYASGMCNSRRPCLDADENFVESILPFIRSLSNLKKMKLRASIQHSIFEAMQGNVCPQISSPYIPAKSICSQDADEQFYWGLIPFLKKLEPMKRLNVRIAFFAEVHKAYIGQEIRTTSKVSNKTNQSQRATTKATESPSKLSQDEQLRLIRILLGGSGQCPMNETQRNKNKRGISEDETNSLNKYAENKCPCLQKYMDDFSESNVGVTNKETQSKKPRSSSREIIVTGPTNGKRISTVNEPSIIIPVNGKRASRLSDEADLLQEYLAENSDSGVKAKTTKKTVKHAHDSQEKQPNSQGDGKSSRGSKNLRFTHK